MRAIVRIASKNELPVASRSWNAFWSMLWETTILAGISGMKALRTIGLGLFIALLASCAPRPTPPQPTPEPPAPRPAPRPLPPPPPPANLNWEVAALSPGGWSYQTIGGDSAAIYGPAGAPMFAVRCERNRQISLSRAGAAAGALTLRTTFGARSLPAAAQQGQVAALVAGLPANDPLLDQLVFSRGRFTVEAAGTPMLIVPTWPEAARVIEDCRS